MSNKILYFTRVERVSIQRTLRLEVPECFDPVEGFDPFDVEDHILRDDVETLEVHEVEPWEITS